MSGDPSAERERLAALRDLVAGRGVRRGRHSLQWGGRDVTDLFLQALALEGFAASRVRDVELELGEKAPAFLVRNSVAEFGWVFWEKYTAERRRKLFGSVVHDAKGDWAVQLGAGSQQLVYVHAGARSAVDPDRPSSWG